MKKPQIRIRAHQLIFSAEFSKQYIQGKKLVNVIETGENRFAVGFFNRESEIPIYIRDEIFELKNNSSDGDHVASVKFAKAYGEGIMGYEVVEVGAEKDKYFRITQ